MPGIDPGSHPDGLTPGAPDIIACKRVPCLLQGSCRMTTQAGAGTRRSIPPRGFATIVVNAGPGGSVLMFPLTRSLSLRPAAESASLHTNHISQVL